MERQEQGGTVEDHERTKPEAVGDFEIWWAKYPNKNHKVAAVKAWRRLTPSPLTIQKMMADLPRWAGVETRFVPHGSSYITGKRWEDEPRTSDLANRRVEHSTGAAVRDIRDAGIEAARLTPEQRQRNAQRLRDIAANCVKSVPR